MNVLHKMVHKLGNAAPLLISSIVIVVFHLFVGYGLLGNNIVGYRNVQDITDKAVVKESPVKPAKAKQSKLS